jgi:chemotaxis protein methyltransferase CheR
LINHATEQPASLLIIVSTEVEKSDYDLIVSLVHERSRIRLHDGKQALIRARLGKRMRSLGFDTFHDYCHYLRAGTDEQELTRVVEALTTNFTSFLRERAHFDFLVQHALPNLLTNGPQCFRVWSAACATGEEPYTLAFYLAESFPLISGWDWRILATDISTQALEKGAAGIYPDSKLAEVPPEWQRRYFQAGHGPWTGQYRIKSSLRERLEFRQLNLLGNYGFTQTFEVVFCRNVMIYFDRATQEQLVKRLTEHLIPSGFLFTGHSESITGFSSSLRCLRPSIYQKR